jgi:hypothetical protein
MSKSTLVSAVILAGSIALAVVLNPSPDQHRAKIKEAVAERSQLEHLLGVGVLTAFASKYSSLGVLSYTTVNERLVSVGVLGMVFVVQ